jgi:hypothetical protein
MDSLFDHLALADVHSKVFRKLVSLQQAQNLFDDLSPKPQDWALAQQVEDAVKPPPYQSRTPILHRPFEDAEWSNAIGWPFKHWQASRFSDGSFGVWYGCDSTETTVFETAYHWFKGFMGYAGFQQEPVVAKRQVYAVACDAALLNLRPAAAHHPGLVHKADDSCCQSVGARLHRKGHPGLIILSSRHAAGHNYVVLNPAVLSNPQLSCKLTYRLQGPRIAIEKQVGVTWMDIATYTL